VADDFGRFEADAEKLRTVLYGLLIAKVSARDVQGALAACQDAGLVKLYRSGGRGYGKVINFRQKLANRRALYPDEEEPPPEPELFTSVPVGVFVPLKEGRKEAPHSPPPEAGGGNRSATAGTQTTDNELRRAVRFLAFGEIPNWRERTLSEIHAGEEWQNYRDLGLSFFAALG
jgi:hypothetical protein